MSGVQVQISDEHLIKLAITDESLVLVRVPMNSTNQQVLEAMNLVRETIRESIGTNPALLVFPQEADLKMMDVEALMKLKDDIDASIEYLLSKQIPEDKD